MANIISPPFSFVRFSDQHLGDEEWLENQLPGARLGEFLPVNVHSDLAFQILIETELAAEADFICTIPMSESGLMVAIGASLPPVVPFSDIQTLLALPTTKFESNQSIGVGRYRISPTEILYYFPRIPALTGTICGACFQLVFTLSTINDYGAAYPSVASNIFIYNCDDTDFTSVLDYYSVRNEAGFNYCADPRIKNRVRLPLYLTKPTFPEEEEILRLSNSQVVIRKSNVRKLYEVVTDGFADWMIESLRAVFMHDNVFIEDAPELPQTMPYKGEIVKEGAYEPSYLDYKCYPKAPVSFKVNAVEYSLKKNNCGICPAPSTSITTTGEAVDLTPSSPYIIDLIPLADVGCCSPIYFVVESFQANYINSVQIAQGNGLATLTFISNASLTADANQPPPLVKVRAFCGGSTAIINITSQMA